jgi:hypothetical protein
VVIWYFFPFWYVWTKKNLATLTWRLFYEPVSAGIYARPKCHKIIIIYFPENTLTKRYLYKILPKLIHKIDSCGQGCDLKNIFPLRMEKNIGCCGSKYSNHCRKLIITLVTSQHLLTPVVGGQVNSMP